jgi:protein SCO1/2
MTPTAKRILIGACVAIGTVTIFALYVPGLRPHPSPQVATSGTPKVGGAFSLIDTHGNRVTDDMLKGHLSLLYFGFTHCPDVCPLALQTMTEALQIAGPVAENVIPVFISVDPERDTPKEMGEYLANFHPRFVGLTGTPEEIKAVTAAYRVYFAKAAGGKPDDYNMAHSDFVYLIGADGRYVTHFRAEDTSLEIANRMRRELMPQ